MLKRSTLKHPRSGPLIRAPLNGNPYVYHVKLIMDSINSAVLKLGARRFPRGCVKLPGEHTINLVEHLMDGNYQGIKGSRMD